MLEKREKKYAGFHRNLLQHNCQLIIITVCWSSDPHIRVISEGSCDTENWSNDDKFKNKLHFTIYSHREQMIYTGVIFRRLYFIYDLINAGLKRLFQKHKTSDWTQTFVQ